MTSQSDRRRAWRIGLTLAASVVAIFGALVVASDRPMKLFLGGFALVFVVDAVQEFRRGRSGDARPRPLDDEPAGPWLVGTLVFVVLFALAMTAFVPSAGDGTLRFAVSAVCFVVAYVTGQAVKLAVSRLPRYRAP